ncbi:hypothetical protein RI196_09965 [Aeribacillus composti]|uniref:Uncharacterized protein n=1 Tax=Aeribacillus composti TaxID=1868734 RepID=A0ABY9WE53_9BACI|nr:hypothetical protein [Aeribacillus composti]WNF31636.1 hypothetical protein RI196_09965 [Aeribacillus composti]
MIEKKLKKPISKIDFENMKMEDLAVMLWAGLVHEDESLTPEKVMDLVDEYSNLQKVTEAMSQAFQASMGNDSEANDGENEETKN